MKVTSIENDHHLSNDKCKFSACCFRRGVRTVLRYLCNDRFGLLIKSNTYNILTMKSFLFVRECSSARTFRLSKTFSFRSGKMCSAVLLVFPGRHPWIFVGFHQCRPGIFDNFKRVVCTPRSVSWHRLRLIRAHWWSPEVPISIQKYRWVFPDKARHKHESSFGIIFSRAKRKTSSPWAYCKHENTFI